MWGSLSNLTGRRKQKSPRGTGTGTMTCTGQRHDARNLSVQVGFKQCWVWSLRKRAVRTRQGSAKWAGLREDPNLKESYESTSHHGWSPHSKKQEGREFFNVYAAQIPKAGLRSSSPGSGSSNKYLLNLYCVQVQSMLRIRKEHHTDSSLEVPGVARKIDPSANNDRAV